MMSCLKSSLQNLWNRVLSDGFPAALNSDLARWVADQYLQTRGTPKQRIYLTPRSKEERISVLSHRRSSKNLHPNTFLKTAPCLSWKKYFRSVPKNMHRYRP